MLVAQRLLPTPRPFRSQEAPDNRSIRRQEAMVYPGVDQFSTGWKGAFAGYGSEDAEEP
jgi:hypothetical protein